MPHSRKQVKDTNFNLRIASQLKADFVAVTANEDVSAGQALRDFMRRYIAKHQQGGKSAPLRLLQGQEVGRAVSAAPEHDV